jgi:hypothetical protein
MKYEPGQRQRRSVRLKGYAYPQNGAYFIPVCVQHREYRYIESNPSKWSEAEENPLWERP